MDTPLPGPQSSVAGSTRWNLLFGTTTDRVGDGVLPGPSSSGRARSRRRSPVPTNAPGTRPWTSSSLHFSQISVRVDEETDNFFTVVIV